MSLRILLRAAVVSVAATIFLSCLLTTLVGGDPAPESLDSIDNWKAELDHFVEMRSRLLSKASRYLEDKRTREEIAKQDDPRAVVEMSAEEKERYRLAQESIREIFAQEKEVAAKLSLHLNERGVGSVAGSRRSSLSYVAFFPAARTLVEMDPRSASFVIDQAASCNTAPMQRMMGSLLNELDGAELAKARLDQKINAMPAINGGPESRHARELANLTAIRKLFDEKDAFDDRRH